MRSVTIVTLVGWIGAIVALALYYIGTPKDSGGIGDYLRSHFKLNVGATTGFLNNGLLKGAFASVVVTFVVCAVGFMLNLMRHKRKTDRYNKLLITLWIVSGILIIAFLIGYARQIL